MKTSLLFAALGAASLAPLAAGAAEPAGAPAATPDAEVAWFAARLRGEPGPAAPGARVLAAGEVAAAKARAWEAYRQAAIGLGWDKEYRRPQIIEGRFPTREEFRKLPPEKRPKLPAFEPGALACDGETMPYFSFAKGPAPAKGRPLFIQMHGGGNTSDKLDNPHAWPVNTRDWGNQVAVCLLMFPEAQYFVPRMANDNKGRWWMRHNHTALDKVIRRAVLFDGVDPDRIYMTGISEGAYGTEALGPFWADRLAGCCAMAGGAGGGERLYNMRNTPLRNDTGENDTMFGRIGLARQVHEFIDTWLKKDDPSGYDHMLYIHPGMGHGIDYAPGPAWVATKVRNPHPDKVAWFNFMLDERRRSEFAWLSLDRAPEHDTLIVASLDRARNAVNVSALANPPGAKDENPVYNTSTPPPVAGRAPYTGNALTVHLDDGMLDLDRPVTVTVNGRKAFEGRVERREENMADDIARHGDPGRVFPARVRVTL